LLDLVEQRGLMMTRIDAVRAALAAGRPVQRIEHKVAASVTHLGLVARLISPALAFVVTTGHLPCTDLSRVWWQDQLGGAFPLSIPDITGAALSHQPIDVGRVFSCESRFRNGPKWSVMATLRRGNTNRMRKG